MAEHYLFQPFATFTVSDSVSCTVKLNACYSRHASANKFLSVNSRHSISGGIAKNSAMWRCFVFITVLRFRYVFVQCPSLCHVSEPHLTDFVILVLLLSLKLTIPNLYWLAAANLIYRKLSCVCMYVCMYVCMCMYVCVYVCMYVCMYVCVYVCMCVYMYVGTYVCIYVCMYVCMYVCLHVHIYSLSYHYRTEGYPLCAHPSADTEADPLPVHNCRPRPNLLVPATTLSRKAASVAAQTKCNLSEMGDPAYK